MTAKPTAAGAPSRYVHSGWRAARTLAATAVLAALAVTGCSQQDLAPTKSTANWLDPLNGVPVASVAAARHRAGFSLRLLRGMRPDQVLITPGVPAAYRVVILVYRTRFGLADVFEQRGQLTQRQFRQAIRRVVAVSISEGIRGTETAVTLRGRVPALITTSDAGRLARIEWFEAGLRYSISGPSLSKRDCVILADRFG